MLRFLFVDSDANRLRGMKMPFRKMEEVEIIDCFQPNFLTGQYDAYLRHAGDQRDLPRQCQAKSKICYGGFGEREFRCDRKVEYCISRPILESGFLDTDEAQSLVNFINDDSQPLPNFLLPKSYDSLMEQLLPIFIQLQSPWEFEDMVLSWESTILSNELVVEAWQQFICQIEVYKEEHQIKVIVENAFKEDAFQPFLEAYFDELLTFKETIQFFSK